MTDTVSPWGPSRPQPSFTDGAPPRRGGGWRIVRGAWKLLVAVKDGLALLLLLLFFGLLFAALNARPGTKPVGDGALLLKLDGPIVEQPEAPAAFAALSGQPMTRQYSRRDLIRAIDAARADARVKAVVLDLDGFGGAYPATLNEVADAIQRVRQSGKPVLAYATAYTDGAYRLASAASEIWMNPMGGTLFAGPGGSQLYYKGLIDKLGVTAHIYRVGKYKSAVEPYFRADQSPEARAESEALYGTLLSQWTEAVTKARPKAKVAAFLTDPQGPVAAANGDIAQANLAAGLVDKLEGRGAFEARVAQIAGAATGKTTDVYRTIRYDRYVAANPAPTTGDAIGVLPVAGAIVDGEAGPGSAAAETIVTALNKGLAEKNLKALVLRVDSPGGSALASERIRLAVLAAKKRGLPIVVSMGGLAASGGYWVSTAGDVIFAEPQTITGSIGIFAVLPTFENALAKIGVTADGVRTTPLTGQPDVLRGTTPVMDTILQAGIENGYRQFITRVSEARHMTPARVNEIGQGRVWDGGTARQIGLVDRFGSVDDAVAEAARRAKLDPANVHAVYLEKDLGWAAKLAESFNSSDDASETAGIDAFARIAAERRGLVARALGDVAMLAKGGPIQARCLACGGFGPDPAATSDARLLELILAKLGLS